MKDPSENKTSFQTVPVPPHLDRRRQTVKEYRKRGREAVVTALTKSEMPLTIPGIAEECGFTENCTHGYVCGLVRDKLLQVVDIIEQPGHGRAKPQTYQLYSLVTT